MEFVETAHPLSRPWKYVQFVGAVGGAPLKIEFVGVAHATTRPYKPHAFLGAAEGVSRPYK